MTPRTTTLLFVYGTLKRGHKNHRRLAGQHYLREAVTAPAYRVYDLGPWPGLVRDARNGLAIRGELWEVAADALRALDDFETGADAHFVREPIDVPGAPGPVEAYFYAGPLPPGAPSGSEWPDHLTH